MRFLLLLIVLILSGCLRPSAPVWTVVPEAQELVSRLRTSAESYQALDVAAQVNLTSGGNFYSTQQFLLIEKPNLLRSDVLTGFGQLVMQLASDGDELEVLLHTSIPGKFYRGPASRESLSRFIRIPLRVEDLVALVLYSPPLISFDQAAVAVSGSDLLLTLSGAGQEQKVRFNSQLQPVEVSYLRDQQLLLRTSYKDFDVSGFPLEMIIEAPGDETRMRLSLSELNLNPLIDATRFRLKIPANVIEEIL